MVIHLGLREIGHYFHFGTSKRYSIDPLEESWTDFSFLLCHHPTNTGCMEIGDLERCFVLWTLMSGAALRTQAIPIKLPMFLHGSSEDPSHTLWDHKYLTSHLSLARMDPQPIRAKHATSLPQRVELCVRRDWNGRRLEISRRVDGLEWRKRSIEANIHTYYNEITLNITSFNIYKHYKPESIQIWWIQITSEGITPQRILQMVSNQAR